ncbi:MAG: hypothetical protein IJV98_00480 [Clostridia bacterium]|nr:hypothetical protein [Clostridia bacterium]
MNRKKLGRALLFPNIAVMLLLLPVSVAVLTYSLLYLASDAALAIASYMIAMYTLTVWCLRVPRIIMFCKGFSQENRYVRRWREDDRLRMNVSLCGSLFWNVAYAVFQLALGIYHRTFWFCSLAGYYFSLAVMRFFLVRHTRKYRPGEQMRAENRRYRTCGWIFLVMNLALSLMIFFMVYWNRTFHHHEITSITMAAYTFAAFAVAIVNLLRYRKYNSPVYSASKAISLAAACVSMLTLESTMLTTWGQNETVAFRRLMLAATGLAVSIFVLTMAIYMIVRGSAGVKQEINGKQRKENIYGKQK